MVDHYFLLIISQANSTAATKKEDATPIQWYSPPPPPPSPSDYLTQVGRSLGIQHPVAWHLSESAPPFMTNPAWHSYRTSDITWYAFSTCAEGDMNPWLQKCKGGEHHFRWFDVPSWAVRWGLGCVNSPREDLYHPRSAIGSISVYIA